MNDALRLLLHFFAGWVNRRQLNVIESWVVKTQGCPQNRDQAARLTYR